MDNSKKPIRVLQVVTIMERAGLENRIMDIYRNIDRNKIQFDFLTHRLEDGDFDSEIKQLGGIVHHLPPIKPWKLIGYVQSLRKFFRTHPEYKIVHAHLNAYSSWVLIAAKLEGVPVRIAHSRTKGFEYNWKVIFKILSRELVNWPTTHKLAVSIQAGEWLFGKKGIEEPNKLIVIPNGIGLSKFTLNDEKRAEMRKMLGLDNQIAFVHVGRLSYPKNHTFLFDIFHSIHKTNANTKLFLLGEGELKDSLIQKAEALGLSNDIVFLGNHPNVGDYLQAMDAMIFPSFYEGFGTVVLETQCSGLPTLASDVLPKETKLTECLEFMSIKDNTVDEWANKALEMVSMIKRQDRTDAIREAGYDIKDSYKIMSDLYLSSIKEN